jgi:hypothetical protein
MQAIEHDRATIQEKIINYFNGLNFVKGKQRGLLAI